MLVPIKLKIIRMKVTETPTLFRYFTPKLRNSKLNSGERYLLDVNSDAKFHES